MFDLPSWAKLRRNDVQSQEEYEEWCRTKRKRTATIYATIVTFVLSGTLYFGSKITHKLISERRARLEHAAAIITVPPPYGNREGMFIHTADGTKLVYPPVNPTVGEMPENVRLANTIFFTKDGSAVIYQNLIYDAVGTDVIWRDHGKWYGFISDPPENIKENDTRRTGFATPEECSCSRITIVGLK